MGEVKKESTKKVGEKKMSYEALEEALRGLSKNYGEIRQRYDEMMRENYQLKMALNAITRVDYLFKVLERDYAFSPEFVNNCVDEIEEFLAVPESDGNEKEDKAPNSEVTDEVKK